MTYKLEKNIWSDSDYEVMGWHDNQVYMMHLGEDLELDLDYIFKWNPPEIEGLPFTFWVAPATLVFKKIRSLNFELAFGFETPIEIEDIEREGADQWTIKTRQGEIQFISKGFVQFIRQPPTFQFGQTISYAERNGYSLERITNQENPNLVRDDIVQLRNMNFELWEYVKMRHIKRRELEKLNQAHDNNEVDTKQYLLKKREISQLMSSFDSLLKGTQFEDI